MGHLNCFLKVLRHRQHAFFHQRMLKLQEGEGERGWGEDWVANHPIFGGKKIMEKSVNIMEDIKANNLDRYLIVISSLWHC